MNKELTSRISIVLLCAIDDSRQVLSVEHTLGISINVTQLNLTVNPAIS